jgi:hypothetical protein
MLTPIFIVGIYPFTWDVEDLFFFGPCAGDFAFGEGSSGVCWEEVEGGEGGEGEEGGGERERREEGEALFGVVVLGVS